MLILKNKFCNLIQTMCWNTAILSKNDWIKPKFTFAITASHMDVWRFISLIRIKMKSILTDT